MTSENNSVRKVRFSVTKLYPLNSRSVSRVSLLYWSMSNIGFCKDNNTNNEMKVNSREDLCLSFVSESTHSTNVPDA